MYGYRLRTWIYRRLILAITFFLTWFTLASWSDNAFEKYHSVLNAALILIGIHFYAMALEHIRRNRELFNWGFRVRFEHVCFFSAFSFFAICIFPLKDSFFPEWLHLAATGLGVSGITFLMLGWYEMWSRGWWLSIIGLGIGIFLLVTAFAAKVPWQVGHGEFMIMLCGLAFFEDIKEK